MYTLRQGIKNVLVLSLLFLTIGVQAQDKVSWDSVNISGIKLRNIGPAFMTGRIADIAIDPKDENHWYIGVASGGVWETKNSGVTFKPLFDKQKVYSIGCITIDPGTGNIWVGSGENVGGRHISYGDGVYLSKDGGQTWKNVGLKASEHISKIIVHPTDPNIVWVASQGPLWNKGGERGVYKTLNGGKDWERVLGDDEWTGATDLLIDPRNPSILYAATWQRHRTVASYLGGGPKSGIHKSTDGGKTWSKLKTGLPGGNMGKIGLAISPQKPDVVYAAIELDLKKGAFYKSENKGASWQKKADVISGGTGPHYYQEIWASPHQFDRVYFANNYLKVTDDGGKTFKNVKKQYKHVDNHAIVFKASDPDYLLVGTDGGLYESFDLAQNWRHMGNLPITQFYKLAVDDATPFYNVYGGTQDNNTQGGPSRTSNAAGITTADWKVVLGGDGHQPATEPGNPNIVYAQSQQGYYSRVDMQTGERIGIRPQPAEGENHERYNWDAPILVSAHDPKRVFVASHRLWRSNDRGDSWKALSGDLTRNEERFELPIMGRKQSYNNPWDVYAMSTYNTITSISESPLDENILYTGTDDGLFHVTTDGGKTWTSTDVKKISGVPERAYVNDIKADLHDKNVVYMALDAHKQGNYTPYLFKSTNNGKSWKNIGSSLPENNYVWRVVQDHVNPNLLFAGTEFGLFFTPDGGATWKKFTGLPTISFRDLAIQKRENDLVAASFGRSFYILDDYSFLRATDGDNLQKKSQLFPVRDAYVYVPRRDGRQKSGSLGGQHYIGKNPDFGAIITYYIRDKEETRKSKRIKNEKELNKKKNDIPFPGWETLDEEASEVKTTYWIIIRDQAKQIVRKIPVANKQGFNRVAWNLRSSSVLPVDYKTPNEDKKNNGFLVNPGLYSASLYSQANGQLTQETESVSIKVKSLHSGSLQEPSVQEKDAFKKKYLAAQVRRTLLTRKLGDAKKVIKAMEVSVKRSTKTLIPVEVEILQTKRQLEEIGKSLSGNKAKNRVGEKVSPTLNDRISAAGSTIWGSNYGPTQTANESLVIANKMMTNLETKLENVEKSITKLRGLLEDAGAPVILD